MSEWNWSAERRTAIGDVANQSLEYVAERLLESRKRAFDAWNKAQQLQAELDQLKAAHAWIKTSERVPEETCDVLGVVDGVVMPLNYAKEGIMSEWTTEEPKTDGAYWLSIAPDKRPSPSGRNDFPPVVKCYIQTYRANALYIGSPAGPLVKYDRGGDWLPLDQDWFKGAQWKLVDPAPADPFADKRPSSSRDNDFL